MYHSRTILPFIAALTGSVSAQAQVGFGSGWAVAGDEAHTETFVLSATTTLQVPNAPQPQSDRLALWSAVETSDGNKMNGLAQSIIVSFANPGSPSPGGCGGTPGQWCAFAGFYTPATNHMDSGTFVPVNAGEMLLIQFNFDPNTNGLTQTVSRDGQVLSTWNSNTGRPFSWNIAVECQDNANGMTPEHTYHDTQIILNQPDMNWQSTLYKTTSSDSGMNSPDGGKTWQIDTITIEAANCTP